MAGIENKILFGEGLKLTPTSARSISDMQRDPTDVAKINFTGDPNGSISANPSSLCHDPVSGNIYYKGSGTGNTGWVLLNTGGFPISPFVVGPIGQADYQTIQDGLNAANTAGGGIVYVQPGTYTENLTLFDQTQVVGAVGLADTGNLIIVGVHTPPASGGFVFRNVTLQSATHIFDSATAGSAHLIIIDAAIIVTNGYTFNLPNWTGKLESFDVNDRGSTDDGYVNNTGGAEVALFSCAIGAGSGNVMTVSGSTSIFTCAVNAPLNCVTGSSVFLEGNVHLNTITFSDDSTGEIVYSEVDAQIIMSSSGSWLISETTINTSSSPAIDGSGAGTLTLGGITFVTGNDISGTLTLAGATGFLPTVLTDGQLIIGKTNSGGVAGSLTSTGGSITITPGPGTINLETAGGGGGITTLDGDTGSATGSTVLVTALGSISGQNCGSSVSFTGSGSTMELDLTDANGNTLIGRGAGKLNTGGTSNVGLGVIALRSISTTLNPNANTAIGYASMASTVQGVNNTAIGFESLLSSIGDWNTALGYASLQSLVGTAGVGDFNTALGTQAGYQIVSGTLNTLIGYNSGGNYTGSESNNLCIAHPGTTGDNDTIRIGLGSKTSCFIAGIAGVSVSNTNMVTIDTTTGQMGSQAVPSGSGIVTINGDSGSVTGSTVTIETGQSTKNSGSSPVFSSSGTTLTLDLTDANFNTVLGNSSGNLSMTGQGNAALGFDCLRNITTGTVNVAIGSSCNSAANTSNNVAIGNAALYQYSGSNSIGIGKQVGFANTGGTNSGSYNVYIGDLVASQNSGTGNNNLGLGRSSLQNITDGSFNVSAGYFTLYQLTTGSYNVALGDGAGDTYVGAESSNICISNVGVVSESNVIRIGTQGTGNGQQNTCFVAGIHGSTVTGSAVLIDANGQLGDIASSLRFKENIQDISSNKQSILDCRPVSFNYKKDDKKTKCFGMIAEEVDKVFPDLVLYKDGEPYSIKYHEMPALLLAEIQKLRNELNELKSSMKKEIK